jgi:hypothetical protein
VSSPISLQLNVHHGADSQGCPRYPLGLRYAKLFAAIVTGLLGQKMGVDGVVDKVIAERFDNVIAKADIALRSVRSSAGGNFADSALLQEWRAQSLTLLQALFPVDAPYVTLFLKRTEPSHYVKDEIEGGKGILLAAQEDFNKGYLWTLKERVHAEVFADFLEMASSLVGDGYIDAAAVIAVGTLEEHMRQLCAKTGVATTVPKQGGSTEPKKASAMNRDLWQQGVYDKPEWRQVDAWLDIRNDPAHGHYKKYPQQQVELMIEGIRGFFLRNPA